MEENENTHKPKKKKIEFTLFQLMLVISVIAYCMACTLPIIVRYFISRPILGLGTIRTISVSQNQFKHAIIKDRDSDGKGEFGFLVELAGIVKVPKGKESFPVKPPFTPQILGVTSSKNNGIAYKSGYNFILYLPSSGKEVLRETGQEISKSQKVFPSSFEAYRVKTPGGIASMTPVFKGNFLNKEKYKGPSNYTLSHESFFLFVIRWKAIIISFMEERTLPYYILKALLHSEKLSDSYLAPLKILPPSEKEAMEIDRQEEYFAVFAWPEEAEISGYKAYFINQLGEIYVTENLVGKFFEEKKYFYNGISKIPEPEDIFDESGKFILDGKLILGKAHPKTGLIWEKYN